MQLTSSAPDRPRRAVRRPNDRGAPKPARDPPLPAPIPKRKHLLCVPGGSAFMGDGRSQRITGLFKTGPS